MNAPKHSEEALRCRGCMALLGRRVGEQLQVRHGGLSVIVERAARILIVCRHPACRLPNSFVGAELTPFF